MAIIMGKGCLEAIYGLMGWKGLRTLLRLFQSKAFHFSTPSLSACTISRAYRGLLLPEGQKPLPWNLFLGLALP